MSKRKIYWNRRDCKIATPFDAPSIAAVKLNYRGSPCSFEAILEDFNLSEPALLRLGLLVRAADVKGQESVAVERMGLRAIAQGFAALGLSDEESMERQFPVYEALYAYVQSQENTGGAGRNRTAE